MKTFLIAHNAILVGADVPGLGTVDRVGIEIAINSTGNAARFFNNTFFSAASDTWAVYSAANGSYSLEGFQNNLVINTAGAQLWTNKSGGIATTTAGLTANMCGSPYYIRTSGNAITTDPPSAPYKKLSDFLISPGGADGDVTTLEDNDWHLLPGAAPVFAMGLDTTIDQCGGAEGTTGACAGTGFNSCGGITGDKDGKLRPATPAAGPYEP
jgi:hypothetical protein